MDRTELRLLGPLELRCRGRPIPLGGEKQRAVLAALALTEGRVLSVEGLIDEVWGEEPPASAAHTLAAYVSRLRLLLGPCGAIISRRGRGYVLELSGARLDVHEFERLCSETAWAVEEGEDERASRLAAQALALWRGPALADVELRGVGAGEVERLEALRLAVLAQRLEAELELGRHEEAVGELQALVRADPYRERFVGLLMLALYRAGRQAEALQVYEQTRSTLADELGLRPSSELRALSGEIVRQGEQLRGVPRLSRTPMRRRVRRGVLAVASVLALAITAGATAVSVAGGGDARTEGQSPARVALVLAGSEWTRDRDAALTRSFASAASFRGLEHEVLLAAALDPGGRELERRHFALVVVVGEPTPVRLFAPVVRRLKGTRFAFLGVSLAEVGLAGVANATALRFADEQASHLAGYLSALVPPRAGERGQRVDVVAAVVGPPVAHVRRLVEGFRSGAKQARPSVVVRVAHAGDSRDRAACERLANEQIDAGADLIFADAGPCGLAAVAVARTRGVWAIGEREEGTAPGPQLLGTLYRDWRRVLWESIVRHTRRELPSGEDVVLGLDDNYAVGLDPALGQIPERVWSRVVLRCSKLRQGEPAISPGVSS